MESWFAWLRNLHFLDVATACVSFDRVALSTPHLWNSKIKHCVCKFMQSELLFELFQIELDDSSTCKWNKEYVLIVFDICNYSYIVLKAALLVIPVEHNWAICVSHSESLLIYKVQIADIWLIYGFLYYFVLIFVENKFIFAFSLGFFK